MKSNKPHIAIVGAGPGDPEFITLKGLKSLQSSDVVLYDALANSALLDYAPQALHIFVGKRAGKHSLRQDEINLLMVQSAFRYGRVVRLKGGDPFVFGRGHEELEFAKTFAIETTIIPGISSALAIPLGQEVPLTKRGLSESFWVITATTKSGRLSRDITLACQSTATVVILMGIRKLEQIARLFQEAGHGEKPVMIVQNGSLQNERKILGSVDTIVDIARKEKIGTPGIIIIGETVRLHKEYDQGVHAAIKNHRRG